MTLGQYFEGISYTTQLEQPQEMEISSLTSDSRQIRPGCLFVCIKGGKFDGHEAAATALSQGAAAVVVEHDLGLSQQILVENTRSAYAILCANHFGNPSRKMKLVGTTGTNGKTTTTFLLKSILQSAGKKVGLMGTIHNEIADMELPAKYTTPDPYQLHAMLDRMAEAGCEYVVMETSSHALDQHRLDGCEFEVGIFTNLTQDHLDYHGTMENYFAAKKRLFSMAKSSVINIDDEHGALLAQELGDKAHTCSLVRDDADYTAKNVVFSAKGTDFILVGNNLIHRVHLCMPGKFSVANAMGAAAACLLLGLDIEEVADGLAKCPGVTGRAEVIHANVDFTIIRDYAHTPDGLEKMISALKEYATGKVVTLFGCAGNRDRTKRIHMAEMAAKYSDFVILTSDNPRDEDPMQIINDAKPGLDEYKTPYRIIPDRYAAIAWALDNTASGDILLLAGKGHEDYQVLHDETIYFDEKVVIQELLEGKPRLMHKP